MTDDEPTKQKRRQGDNDDPWYLDRRIPLAVILTFMFQGGALVWYAASETAKVDDLARRMVIQESLLTGAQGLPDRLTRVEEKQSAAQKSLDRIETILATPTTPDPGWRRNK